jgi:hypothetical protein
MYALEKLRDAAITLENDYPFYTAYKRANDEDRSALHFRNSIKAHLESLGFSPKDLIDLVSLSQFNIKQGTLEAYSREHLRRYFHKQWGFDPLAIPAAAKPSTTSIFGQTRTGPLRLKNLNPSPKLNSRNPP